MPETTTPAPAAEPATSETLVRRRHTRLLVVMSSMIVLAGTLVAVLFWLQPLRPPTLLPIFIITDSSTGERLPWEEQDLQGLLHDARLGRPLEPIAANPSRDEIRTRLRGLAFASKDRPVVLYLTGRVCVDQAGEVLLLPGDPRRDHARNRLPFAEILAGLRDSPARQKLLVVQFTPVTDPTICEASPSVISAAVFRTFDSVADPTRLCICSCIPGETPLAAAELGRTVFGHYLDSGLRGAADGWNRDGQLDGRVSAHELAAFVHVRVSAWAAANRQVKQTPVLIGDASDFSLRVLPSDGEGGRQLPEPLVYPEFLREAWKHEPRDSSLLIDLEQAWQGGRSNDEIKRLFESRQKEMEDRSRKLGSVARPTPPPTLALARTLDASDEALREELRAAIRRVESKPTLPDKTPAPLLPPELDPFKTRTPEVLGSAVLELLADDPAPSPSRFRMLAALLASNDPVPRFVETVLIQRLARFFEEKPNAIVALRSILHLARDIERSTADVEAFPWIATVLEAVEQARLAAEVALFSEGYLPSVEAARLIGDAEAAAARLRSLLADFHLAESTRREAIALARHASPLIEKNLIPIDAADQLEGAVDRLANLLEVPTQPIDLAELATYPARWREQARLVREAMAEFSRPFDSTALSRWWTWLEASDAGPKVLDEIDTLLKTPFLPADQRVEWWDARDRLARRLNNVTIEQNRRDDLAVREGGGAKLWVDPALRFDQRVAPISRDLIESWPMRWKMLSGNEESQSRSLPEQAKKLWAWQAARFAHLADMSIVGDRSFAKQVEQAFRRAAGPMVDPPVLEIDHVGDIALGRERLTATTQLRLRVRNVDGPVKFGLRLLTPDAGWLVVPESFTGELSPLKEKTLLINLAAGSKPHLFPEARGALVEARIGERVWYYPLPVLVGSLSSKFELYVKSTPQAAALPVTDLRLRPNLPPQAMTVLLANVSAKAQTVVAKLRDPVRETAVITIPPGQFKPLAFPPPAPVVPLVPPAPMGQPATPVADFQDLTGPLTVEILQADTRELLQVLTLPVRVADPSQYLTVDEVVFQPATAERGNRLGVRVKAESPLGAEPCLIQLSVPEDRNPGIVLRERKFQAILDNDMPSVTLYAEKIGLLDAGLTPLTAFLNADGCPRAFTFTGVVSPTGGKVTLQPVLGPRIKVRAEEFSSAATPLPVLLEVDQPPEGATVLLELGLADGQELKPDVVKRLPFAKTKSVAVKLMSEGVIQFRTTLADLKTTLAVEQLAGTRLLRASLLDSSRKVIAQDTVTVVFDGSAPTGVAFVDPVARARRDLPLPVKATCDPPLSGVKEVRFFVGKPVNDAPPPMAAMTPGEPTDATGRFWTAKLLVGEAKGPTPISVQFTARGGRSSIATITVDLLDAAEFNKPIPGKIIGKVREGTLDQPGMIVILRDAKGAEKARTKTRENGTYEFLDVPPGKYSVFTNKTSTNRSANKVIEVKAAEEVSVILELLL